MLAGHKVATEKVGVLFRSWEVALDQKTYELIGTDYPGNMTLKDSGSK